MKNKIYTFSGETRGTSSRIRELKLSFLLKTTFAFILFLFSVSGLFAQTVVTITSNGTFTVPAGVTSLTVEVWGTGGSGGGATGTTLAARGGGGGGGGGYTLSNISVTPGQVFTATIGALGSTGTGAGGAGGASSFISGATNVTANGGAGGQPTNGVGGAGGTGTLNGGSGGTGNASNGAGGGGGAGNLTAGSNGTTTAFGAGGTGSPNIAPYIGGNGGANKTATGGSGNSGAIPGGGGGGGRGAAFFGTATGGVGGSGQIVVTYTAPVCPASTSISPTSAQSGCENFTTTTLTATPSFLGTVGSPTVQYQWYYNTTNSNTIAGATLLAGETNATYTPLSTAAESGTRYYFCVAYAADNGCGQTNTTQSQASGTVAVTVKTPPASVVSPSSQTICNGDIVTLTGTSTGYGYVASSTTSILGSGSLTTTSNVSTSLLGPNPFQTYYGGNKQQMLITASELAGMGLTITGASITDIAIYLAGRDATTLSGLTVKMQHTTLTALTTTPVTSGWTIVRNTANFTTAAGVNNIALNTPFAWNGTDNLLIEINYSNNNTGALLPLNTATYDNTSFVSTWFYRADNVTAAAMNTYSGTSSFTYSARNRMRFIYKNSAPNLTAPTWTGTTASLYSDAGATVPYVAGTPANTVYGKPTSNTTYTATVSDFGVCANTSTSVITVNQQPAFTVCPSNMILPTTSGLCETVVTYTATATGTPAPTITYTFSGATTGSGSGTGSGETFAKGVTTVTITASNICAPDAVCTFTVTINDTENPVITCPEPVSFTADAGLCTSSASIGTATATDNCPGVTVSANPAGPYSVGTTTVTWTATDASGNTATCTQTVNVTDTENPVITCPATANITTDAGLCTSSASIGTPTVTDNCSGATASASPAGPYAVGSHTITWTATDASGNTASCTQTVNVTDAENPVITCPATANITADAGLCTSSASIGTAIATDNCGTPVITSDAPLTFPIGTTTVTWTATDASGNTETCTQTVNVTDTENPVITCPATANIIADAGLCTSSASIGTATATDNCSGVTVSASPAGPYSVGTTTVTWTATDASGNTATCTQTVNVTDTENPVITCPATANITTDAGLCTSSASIGTPTVTDNCSGATASASPSGPYAVGSHTITWIATDASGNTASCTQTVNVTDAENPVITCPATANITADAGLCTSSASIGTATATDNCGTPVITSDAPLTFPIGTTTVTWTATDASGNTATCIQTVNVTDTENPTITCPSDVISCSNTPALGTPTFNDNCSGTVVTNNAPGSFPLGLTVVTWTATDASGNTATCTQNVTVNGSPTAVISGSANICAGGSTNLTLNFTGTAPWLYAINGGTPVSTSNNPESVSVSPATTTTYTITSLSDASCSGTASGSATISVSSAPPVGSCTITTMPSSGCVGNVVTVSTTISAGATGYNWSVPSGTLINGVPGPLTTVSNTVSITLGPIPANASGWEICAFASNPCGNTNTNCKYIRGVLSTPAPITGSSVACPSTGPDNYSTLAVSGASSYLWTITGDATVTGTGITASVTFGPYFTTGTLCVRALLPCGYQSTARCMTISNGTPVLGAMSGTFTVCPGTNGVSYSVPPASGANLYTWTLPAGASIATGSGTNAITVDFGPTYNGGTICVTGTSICGIISAPRCKTVANNKPGTPGNFTSGALSGVCGQTITYSIANVAGASSYTWTPPSGASLSSPNGSNSIDVTFTNGYTTGNLCVTANNGCGASTPRCVLIKGTPATPGVIGGPAVVCANESGDNYSITPVYGATGYTWTTPSGTTIVSGQGTSSIIIDWGANGGVISVTATGTCGNSGTRTLTVLMTCRVSGNVIPGAEISAYPNPVSNILNVDVKAEMSGTYTVELLDLSGRIVYETTINTMSGINSNQLDVSRYVKGMYMLRVINSDGIAKQIRVAVE